MRRAVFSFRRWERSCGRLRNFSKECPARSDATRRLAPEVSSFKTAKLNVARPEVETTTRGAELLTSSWLTAMVSNILLGRRRRRLDNVEV